MTEQTINALCEKFHTTVDNLIPVYSQYAMSKDIGQCVICIVLIIISVLYFIYLKHYIKKEKFYDCLDIPVHHIILSVVLGITVAVCFILICVDIYDYILWLNCPQMRFLDYITHMGGK